MDAPDCFRNAGRSGTIRFTLASGLLNTTRSIADNRNDERSPLRLRRATSRLSGRKARIPGAEKTMLRGLDIVYYLALDFIALECLAETTPLEST